jgi:hypothetical protein
MGTKYQKMSRLSPGFVPRFSCPPVFDFPDAGVGEVVGLFGEGSDEPFEAQGRGGSEPLDAVVGWPFEA